MRFYLLTATLVAAAEALPKASSSPGVSSSSPTSTSTSSSIASSTSSHSAPAPTEIRKVCENGGQTLEAWEELDMGSYLNSTASMFCEDEEKCPYGPWKMDFMQSISNQSGDKTQIDCMVGLDGCDIHGNADMCTNETYARLYFILSACKHFHDHIQAVITALEYGVGDAALKQANWVVTFTKDREDVYESAKHSSATAVILAGVFAVVAGLLALLGPVGLVVDAGILGALAGGAAVGGILSGAATIATGAINAMAINAALHLQNEIDNIATMGDALAHGFEKAVEAVTNIGGYAINETPKNYDLSKGYTYKDDPSGAPAILNSGAYAEASDWKDIRDARYHVLESVSASAIGFLWKRNDQAIVAKVTADMNGEAPCDIDIGDDMWRECDDDGNAYFFARWKEVYHMKEAHKKDWETPYGIKHAPDEGVSLLDMAKSAVYTTEQYGVGHEWDPEGAANAWLSDNKPPALSMVDLPACTVDSDYFHPNDYKCEGQCLLKFNIKHHCSKLWPEPNFPYEKE